MFKKLVSFIVAAAMLCSLLVFVPVTAAAQDEGTGTFTADITKNDDASWHIVDTCGWHSFQNTWKSGTNGEGTQLYCATGENKTTTNKNEQYNWWVVVGDAENITADKEIKTFSLHVANAGKDIIKVLGSSTLKGEYTEIPMSASEDDKIYFPQDDESVDKAPNVLCTYNLGGKGFRYVKIESYGGTSYLFHDVGVWSYTYGDAVTSFEVDDTKKEDAAWGIIDCSKTNGMSEHQFADWDLANNDGEKVYTIGSKKIGDVERTKYWVMIGNENALTLSRELKTFTLQSRCGSTCAHVLVSSDKNGEFVEIAPYSEKEDTSCYETTRGDGCFSAYAPKKLCKYDLSGYNARYIKIQMTSDDWGNAGIGRWTYTYGDATNSFTANNKLNTKEAWGVVDGDSSFTSGKWMYSENDDVYAVDIGGSGKYVIIGGLAAEDEIKTFELRSYKEESSGFNVCGSDKLDGDYVKINHYATTSETEYTAEGGYMPKNIYKYDLAGLGYRYIKIQTVTNSTGYDLFGKWTYTWGERGSGHFDLGAYDTANKRFKLTNYGTTASVKTDNNMRGTYLLADGTAYMSGTTVYALQGNAASTSATENYGNLIVTLPTNVNVKAFYFDGIWSAADNTDNIQVSTSTDGSNYTVVTPEKYGSQVKLYSKNSETGALEVANNYNRYQTWACAVPEGTKYVKISLKDTSYYQTIGKMSYDWTIADSIEAEYAKGLADTIDAKVRVLANNGIEDAVVVLAGYADDELKAVQVVNAGDITGYESFGLAVKADGVTKARAYLWNGADLTPIANFNTYTVE